MARCPKCGHNQIVKAGKIWGKQRWKCKGCGYQFTRDTPRGRPIWQKQISVFLYCHGISMNALARMFKVRTSSVLKWIRRFAEEHYEKPEPQGKAIIMELDEIWHYVKKRPASSGYGKLLIVIEDSCLTGNVGIVIQPH